MALLTLHRSPSGSGRSTPVTDKDEESLRRSRFQRRHSFVMVKGAALLLQEEEEETSDGSPVHSSLHKTHKRNKSAGDQDQLQRGHLQAMVDLLRPEDNIKLAVRLESVRAHRIRYLLVVSKMGCAGEGETILLGVDFANEGRNHCTIGMVLPIWSNTQVFLDGDGGFSVTSDNMTRIFKPISVQTMWSMMQVLHKACESAFNNNHFPASSALGWVQHYQDTITSEQSCINEWMAMSDLLSVRPDSPAHFMDQPSEREIAEHTVRAKLREVMMTTDLETITSKEIRNELERRMNCSLKEYKEFIDNEMLLILAQMDRPSRIFDYLYLGSEWNASNLEELQKHGVSHILNVTREIDNFFPESLKYLNVRVYDEETTDLLPHWKETYRFISNARKHDARVLVHCKMGVSRSGSTVIAYAMKEYGWSLEEALRFVKEKRPIVCPNPGFMRQLLIYQGILDASKQRHNDLWELKTKRDQSEALDRKKKSAEIDGSVTLETNDKPSPIDEEEECSETDESEEEAEEEEEEDVPTKSPPGCFRPLEGLEAELNFLAVASPRSQADKLTQASLEETDQPTIFVHEMEEEKGDPDSDSDDSMAEEVMTHLRGPQSESVPSGTSSSLAVPESVLTPRRQRINLWSVMRSISEMETLDQEAPPRSPAENLNNSNSKHEEVFLSSTDEPLPGTQPSISEPLPGTQPSISEPLPGTQPSISDVPKKKHEVLLQTAAVKSRVKKRLPKQARALIDKEACAHPHRPHSGARALARHKLGEKKVLKQVSYQPQSGKVRKQARVLDRLRQDPDGVGGEDWQDIGGDEEASEGAVSKLRPRLKHLQSVAELKKAALVSRQTKAFEHSQRPQRPLSPHRPEEASTGSVEWDLQFAPQEEMVLSPTALPETLSGVSGSVEKGHATILDSREAQPPTPRLERSVSGPKKMVRWENVEGDEPPVSNGADEPKVSHENGAS